MKKIITIISFITLIFVSHIQALSDNYKIQTKKQAYDVAIKVSGFEKEIFLFDSLVNSDIILDTIFDDNIPFWVPEDSGTLVWVVTFDEFKYTPDEVNKKTYKVYLIAKTKQLMKITGQEDVSKEFFMDKISKESLMGHFYFKTQLDEFHTILGEEMVMFPDSLPQSKFMTLLKNAVFDPFSSKEIYAVCINSSLSMDKPRLAWVIVGDGRPVVDYKYKTKPKNFAEVYSRIHRGSFFNCSRLEWYFMDSSGLNISTGTF